MRLSLNWTTLNNQSSKKFHVSLTPVTITNEKQNQEAFPNCGGISTYDDLLQVTYIYTNIFAIKIVHDEVLILHFHEKLFSWLSPDNQNYPYLYITMF